MLNRVKTDLDFVKYTKKGFFTQNMRLIEKKKMHEFVENFI